MDADEASWSSGLWGDAGWLVLAARRVISVVGEFGGGFGVFSLGWSLLLPGVFLGAFAVLGLVSGFVAWRGWGDGLRRFGQC